MDFFPGQHQQYYPSQVTDCWAAKYDLFGLWESVAAGVVMVASAKIGVAIAIVLLPNKLKDIAIAGELRYNLHNVYDNAV